VDSLREDSCPPDAVSVRQDEAGVSEIVGALMLVVVVSSAAFGFGVFLHQQAKVTQAQKAQDAAVKAEHVDVRAILPVDLPYAGHAGWDRVAVTLTNLNTKDVRITSFRLNGQQAAVLHLDPAGDDAPAVPLLRVDPSGDDTGCADPGSTPAGMAAVVHATGAGCSDPGHDDASAYRVDPSEDDRLAPADLSATCAAAMTAVAGGGRMDTTGSHEGCADPGADDLAVAPAAAFALADPSGDDATIDFGAGDALTIAPLRSAVVRLDLRSAEFAGVPDALATDALHAEAITDLTNDFQRNFVPPQAILAVQPSTLAGSYILDATGATAAPGSFVAKWTWRIWDADPSVHNDPGCAGATAPDPTDHAYSGAKAQTAVLATGHQWCVQGTVLDNDGLSATATVSFTA